MNPKRIAFQTLGCRLNQMESEALASDFLRAGYKIVDFDSPADCYVINTCTVTNKADRKSRNQVHRAERQAALTVVTGCSVNAGVFDEDPGILRITNETKPRLFELVDARLKGEDFVPGEAGDTFSYHLPEGLFRTRGALKIQDGCDSFCTYCIIPSVRGPGRSLDPDVAVSRLDEMIRAGFKEIVVTGVNIGRYSFGGLDFTALLKVLLGRPGDYRLRISSLEPEGLGEDFCRLFTHEKLCPHLHLCLQSGSDRVLENMGRAYRYADFRALVEGIRAVRKDFFLTTDLIVGFPGESEDDFLSSFNAIGELGISHVHIFPFSVRQGTAAQKMKPQIDATVKNERCKNLAIEALRVKKILRTRLIGSTVNVLTEKKLSDGLLSGSCEYYCEIRFMDGLEKGTDALNRIVPVRITGCVEENSEIILTGERA